MDTERLRTALRRVEESRQHEKEAARVLGIARQNGWGVVLTPTEMTATPYIERGKVYVFDAQALTEKVFRDEIPWKVRRERISQYSYPFADVWYRYPHKPVETIVTSVV